METSTYDPHHPHDGDDPEDDFDDENFDSSTYAGPLYLLGVAAICWRCSRSQPVVALGANHPIGEFVVLSNVTAMPPAVVETIRSKRTRPYRLHRSKAHSHTPYYTNFCQCGANYGDFYLHHEPFPGSFYVTNPEEASQISIWELPVQGPFLIESDVCVGVGHLIVEHAKRVA